MFGLFDSKPKRKRVYKYKRVKRGVVISKHYTKKAATAACRSGEKVLPISAPTKIRKRRSLRRY